MVQVTLEKMSKSKGNVVAPDALIDRYGVDTQRLYTLFIGPPEKDAEWNDSAVLGAHRFLNKLWETVHIHLDWMLNAGEPEGDPEDLPRPARDLYRKTHRTIRKVTEDMEGDFHFNTAISAVMELVNLIRASGAAPPATAEERRILKEAIETSVVLLSPFVPHLCEELWRTLGHDGSIFREPWPGYDEAATLAEEIEIPIQVNGRLRSRIVVSAEATDDEIRSMALGDDKVRRYTEGKEVKRVILVPKRLVNVVID